MEKFTKDEFLSHVNSKDAKNYFDVYEEDINYKKLLGLASQILTPTSVSVDIVGKVIKRGDYIVYSGKYGLKFGRYICREKDALNKSYMYVLSADETRALPVHIYRMNCFIVQEPHVPEEQKEIMKAHKHYNAWFGA